MGFATDSLNQAVDWTRVIPLVLRMIEKKIAIQSQQIFHRMECDIILLLCSHQCTINYCIDMKHTLHMKNVCLQNASIVSRNITFKAGQSSWQPIDIFLGSIPALIKLELIVQKLKKLNRLKINMGQQENKTKNGCKTIHAVKQEKYFQKTGSNKMYEVRGRSV